MPEPNVEQAAVPAGNGQKRVSAEPPAPTQSLISKVEEASHLVREIGRGLGEIGSADNTDALEFANFIEREIERFTMALLKRKRVELARLERIIGKSSD